MPYDPNFIAGEVIAPADLGKHTKAGALNNGVPIHHARFSVVLNEIRGFAISTAHNIDGASSITEDVIKRVNNF